MGVRILVIPVITRIRVLFASVGNEDDPQVAHNYKKEKDNPWSQFTWSFHLKIFHVQLGDNKSAPI